MHWLHDLTVRKCVLAIGADVRLVLNAALVPPGGSDGWESDVSGGCALSSTAGALSRDMVVVSVAAFPDRGIETCVLRLALAIICASVSVFAECAGETAVVGSLEIRLD